MGMNKKTQKAYDHLKELNADELIELLEHLPILPVEAILKIGMKIIHDLMYKTNDEIERLNEDE